MRRSSNAVLQTQTSEPMIVVEDSNQDPPEGEEEDNLSEQSSEDESPNMNPYLLSPYARDIRKHSLPTPQCTGITASQVRRLSERGETVGPGPRQAEFLATLSTAPTPTPGGRRHSVVTISKVPPAFFGRNRRESMANFSSGAGFPGRILPNRRESIACPPSTEPRGSVHNLQLDIMDDIVQARKVRMKVWNTSSEKLCEVQPLDDGGGSGGSGGGVQRYTNSGRRFSDFVGTTLAPIPSSSKRRASELPQPPNIACTSSSASKLPTTGIVCSNTDLISILTSLSSSELNQQSELNQTPPLPPPEPQNTNHPAADEPSGLKSNRSNSFDVTILNNDPQTPPTIKIDPEPPAPPTPPPPPPKPQEPEQIVETEPGKVMWDERSGSLVDAHALGSAIEVFLRKTSPETSTSSTTTSPQKSKSGKPSGSRKNSWFSKNDDDSETCDSSLCSTLKDLFVK